MSTVRSFGEMVSFVLVGSHNSGDTSDARTRARNYVNDEYMALCDKIPFPGLISTMDLALAVTAQSDTKLPKYTATAPLDMRKLLHVEIYNNDGAAKSYTAPRIITHREFMDRTRGADRDDTSGTGRPAFVAIRRTEGLSQHLQGTSQAYTVKSSSASDVTSYKVQLTGYSDADHRREVKSGEITLTGVTAVAAGTFYFVTYAGKNDATTGYVSILAGTDVVGEIMPWDRTCYNNVLEWGPWPDMAYVAQIEYLKQAPLMVTDSDVAWFVPGVGHEVIMERALAKALHDLQDTAWQEHMQLADYKENELMRSVFPEQYDRAGIVLE